MRGQWLGRIEYLDAVAKMEALRARILDGDASAETLLLVEHAPVITLGRRARAEHVLASEAALAARGVTVARSSRGGDVTYHGPGQLVAYPIVLLREGSERDLHKYLRNLEEAVIRTCARLGVAADREPGKTGVWTTIEGGARKKLCSMGIACRKWVTFHGLALNVTTDLAYFARINPCGFEASVMTSLAALVGEIDIARVRTILAEELGATLTRTASP